MKVSHPSADPSVLTASEIAALARVTPSAVSNWRKRYADFPKPTGTAPRGGDLFLRVDVEAWLKKHRSFRKQTGLDARQQLWSVADRLRGTVLHSDLVGAVAAGAALLHLGGRATHVPQFRGPAEARNWVEAAINDLSSARPELDRLFTPLEVMDAESLMLVLASLRTLRNRKELAEALDYVFERASRYGEYYTPEPVALLLAELASQEGAVFDPAVGSGELLLKISEAAGGKLRLFGQEVNESAWRTAFVRLLLRGLEAHIALGDSLLDDRLSDLRVETVVCEPPAGMRAEDLAETAGDSRWRVLGGVEAPPSRASDFAWIAHAVHHLLGNGHGYVILPRGSLFRRGAEGRFRAELVRQGTVEAVIALPGGSLAGTGIPAALWIVRPPLRDPKPVLMIDVNGQDLSENVRSKLVETVRTWRSQPERFTPEAGFATAVSVLDLLGGDAPLVPGQWLYEPGLVDLGAMIIEVENAEKELADARRNLPPRPPRVALSAPANPPHRRRVRDLIDLGLAKLIRAPRLKTDQYGEEGWPVWVPADVREPWKREEKPRFLAPELVDHESLTKPGDIVLTTIGGLRTRVDEEGGHILGTSLQALRVDQDRLDPHLVAALLASEPNRRLISGTIPRVNVHELEIPHLDLETAKQASRLLRRLERELSAADVLAARANRAKTALIEALAAGAVALEESTKTKGDGRRRRSSRGRTDD
jgi:hypothetical protein